MIAEGQEERVARRRRRCLSSAFDLAFTISPDTPPNVRARCEMPFDSRSPRCVGQAQNLAAERNADEPEQRLVFGASEMRMQSVKL